MYKVFILVFGIKEFLIKVRYLRFILDLVLVGFRDCWVDVGFREKIYMCLYLLSFFDSYKFSV